MLRRTAGVAAMSTALLTILAGCGSGDDPARTSTAAQRAASGVTRVCPEKNTGVDVPVAVANNLDVPVQLWFTGIDCMKWSGRTPAYYSGGVVSANTKVPTPVRVWSGGVPKWTTTLRTADGRTNITSFTQNLIWGRRVNIVQGTSHSRDNVVNVPGTLIGGKAATVRMRTGNVLTLDYVR